MEGSGKQLRWANTNRCIPWATPNAQIIPVHPLRPKHTLPQTSEDTRCSLQAPIGPYLPSWEAPDSIPVPGPTLVWVKKKIATSTVIVGCSGRTLIISTRKHSDGKEKSECWNHLHPPGCLWIPTPPGTPLLGLLGHLHSLCSGEHGYDCDHKNQPWAPHPVYFFLSHLSFLDFCYSSVDIRTISYMGCMMQFSFGWTFVIMEIFMLAVMAYDQFVAVCNHLFYMVAIYVS